MTAAVLALAAALAALVVVALVWAGGRRARAGSEERITRALAEIGAHMDALSHDLSGAIARVHEDSLRARVLGELGTSLDVDEVLARTAEAAATVPGVDGAVVRAEGADGGALVAAVGVPEDEARHQVVSGPPDGRRSACAVALTYIYTELEEPPGALRSAMAVPLTAGDGEPLGFLAVYSHDAAPALSPEALERLRTIADAAGPAIDNARRFREAHQHADSDTLTGLSNRRTFHDALAREVARAHRYGRQLALVVLDLDDFRAINERVGQLAGDAVLAEVAARIREAVRGADAACRIGGDEFAVILAESGRVDAEGLVARVLATLRRDGPALAPGLTVSAGIAELQPDDDALTLLERADGALARAKASGKGTAA